jgi:hypothetical protein
VLKPVLATVLAAIAVVTFLKPWERSALPHVEGLERKSPAALWAIGDLQKDDKSAWVWFLAACKSGYDCSQSAEWYQSMCQADYNCQPYETGTDLIRRINAGRYPDLELLSNELLKQIDAREVGDLGLR